MTSSSRLHLVDKAQPHPQTEAERMAMTSRDAELAREAEAYAAKITAAARRMASHDASVRRAAQQDYAVMTKGGRR